MHDLSHRAAVALLLICGLLTAMTTASGVDIGQLAAAADARSPLGQAQPLLQHWQFMMGLLGAGMVLAAFLPSLRLPAIGASVLTKAAFVAIELTSGFGSEPGLLSVVTEAAWVVLLLLAAVVFLREARQEARWNGMLPLRPEA